MSDMMRSSVAFIEAAERPLAFTVYGPPVPKARARKGKGGHWHTPKRTQQYEASIANHALAARCMGVAWPRDRAYKVECAIYMPNRRRVDADNILKAVADACNGILWHDDSQITDIATMKRIDADNPRIDVRVYVLEAQP